MLARTVLVRRLLAPGGKGAFDALDARDVQAFESQLQRRRGGPPTLPAALAKRARALLDAATPPALAGAAAAVAERWLAGLGPLEPVLVRKLAPAKPTPRSRAKRKPKPKPRAAPSRRAPRRPRRRR
jgi:hypothetical protein